MFNAKQNNIMSTQINYCDLIYNIVSQNSLNNKKKKRINQLNKQTKYLLCTTITLYGVPRSSVQ